MPFQNPNCSEQIALGLQQYCRTKGIKDIRELIGTLRT